jgi:small subunit ribosomal protein S4
MARYTGPKTKINRKFGEPILGGKGLNKNSNPPGQHGGNRRRKQKSEYGVQLAEKQKAKYTYGVLERRFRNTFKEASRLKGVTGDNLMKLLESRLDNVVYRMGMNVSRPGARQLVSHKHIQVNGEICNIPSYRVKPGDVISVKEKSAANGPLVQDFRDKDPKISWIDYSAEKMQGTYIADPERESIPENINVQLIVELYSK